MGGKFKKYGARRQKKTIRSREVLYALSQKVSYLVFVLN